MDIEKIRQFLKEIKSENIKFKQHFYDKCLERPISENLVREYLKKTDNLLRIEPQQSIRKDEKKFKLWIKLSNRYNLVLVITISQKDLYIITGWNTDRKWKK